VKWTFSETSIILPPSVIFFGGVVYFTIRPWNRSSLSSPIKYSSEPLRLAVNQTGSSMPYTIIQSELGFRCDCGDPLAVELGVGGPSPLRRWCRGVVVADCVGDSLRSFNSSHRRSSTIPLILFLDPPPSRIQLRSTCCATNFMISHEPLLHRISMASSGKMSTRNFA
jgi:hypothetical protein